MSYGHQKGVLQITMIGIVNRRAPELRVPYWIDGEGRKQTNVMLRDLGVGYKILYCFQHWCPGCHSRGFPTLKRIIGALNGKDFGFAAVQTVFEGTNENTMRRLRENQSKYDLKIPFGHDPKMPSRQYPSVMEDYQTAGTPWFVVINPAGDVIYNDFSLDTDRFITALSQEDLNIVA